MKIPTRLPKRYGKWVIWGVGYPLTCFVLCLSWGVDVSDLSLLSRAQCPPWMEAILGFTLTNAAVCQLIWLVANGIATAYITWSILFHRRLLPQSLILLIVAGIISAFMSNWILGLADSYRATVGDPSRSSMTGYELLYYISSRAIGVTGWVVFPAIVFAAAVSYCRRF